MTHIRVKTPNYVPGFFNAMDKFLGEDFQKGFLHTQPAVNILEKEKSYEIVLMAPGLNKSDFNISLNDNLLTISYEKQETKTEEKENFIKREFSAQSFKRSFTVNEATNMDDVKATYENGLLTVTLPKVEVEAKVKNIPIN